MWLFLLPFLMLFALSWSRSLTGDEALTETVSGLSYGNLLRTVSLDNHVPGYYTLLWAWVRVFGNGLFALRLFALLPVLFMLVLSIRFLRSKTAILLSVSPFLLHLSVELRMYGLLALCVLLFLFVLKRYLHRQKGMNLVLLIISISLCTWIHHFGWLALASALTLLLLRREWSGSFLLLCGVVLLYTPWLSQGIAQWSRYGSASMSGSVEFLTGTSLSDRLIGAPFSIAGALIRFAAGMSAVSFSKYSLDELDILTLPAIVLSLALFVLVFRGFRKGGAAPLTLLLWTLIPLSFLRPSPRHFAIAFPAYMILAGTGSVRDGRLSKYLFPVVVLLLVVLCVPFALRSTMPQRCTFDRDFMEAAEVTVCIAESTSLPVVIHLDVYSTLGLLYHMEQTGEDIAGVAHPHDALFRTGLVFYEDVESSLEYLSLDTDSLVSSWISLYDRGFLLLANDPRHARGRIFGPQGGEFMGMGSDVMSDSDLIESLQAHTLITEIELRNSSGPFSLFLLEPCSCL
jgi:uncharacterized membrane protein